jgi:hypothetical protein
LLVGTCLYLATAQRSVSWQDSGMFQYRVITADYTGQLGLALAHPLYIAAGQLARLAGPARTPFLLNAFSGLGMALAAANVAAIAAVWTSRRWIGLAVAAMLLTAHTAWWLATIAEVYTWSVAGLTAEIWFLTRLLDRPTKGRLALLAGVNGLGLCLHNLALLALPVYLAVAVVLILRKHLPGRSLALAAATWILAAGPYLAMTVHLAVVTSDPTGAIRSALVGQYAAQVLNVARASANFRANMALTALNFASLLGPLAAVGLVVLSRRLGRRLGWTILAITAVELLFFIRYNVPDQFTFFLPSLVMLCLAGAVGLSALADTGRVGRGLAIAASGLSVMLPPIVYAAGPGWIQQAGIRVSRSRTLPYRDETRYWMVPWKHNETSAARFAFGALHQADGQVVLVDSTSLFPLLAAMEMAPQTIHPRPSTHAPDPALQSPEAFEKRIGRRGVYAVSPQLATLPNWMHRSFRFVESAEGPLWIVLRARRDDGCACRRLSPSGRLGGNHSPRASETAPAAWSSRARNSSSRSGPTASG